MKWSPNLSEIPGKRTQTNLANYNDPKVFIATAKVGLVLKFHRVAFL